MIPHLCEVMYGERGDVSNAMIPHLCEVMYGERGDVT